MATIKGIEVSGTIYDTEDETARASATENANSIGNLSDLATTTKSSIVNAINEVVENGSVLTHGAFTSTNDPSDEITISYPFIKKMCGKTPSELTNNEYIIITITGSITNTQGAVSKVLIKGGETIETIIIQGTNSFTITQSGSGEYYEIIITHTSTPPAQTYIIEAVLCNKY